MRRTIVGRMGTGKTSLAKQLIRESKAKYIFILDFIGEYWDIDDDRIIIRRGDLYNFCKLAWDYAGKNFKTLIVFDEVDNLKDYYGLAEVNKRLGFLYRYGRHKNLDLIVVSRTFYEVPIIARRLTREYDLFQITEDRDLKFIKPYIPVDPKLEYDLYQIYVQTLINLKTFQYIIISL